MGLSKPQRERLAAERKALRQVATAMRTLAGVGTPRATRALLEAQEALQDSINGLRGASKRG